jgi:hypothetical protein
VEFFEKNLDKLKWNKISENVMIPEWFCEKYADKLDWYKVATTMPYSVEFFEKHLHRFSVSALVRNKLAASAFFEKHPELLIGLSDCAMEHILEFTDLPTKLFTLEKWTQMYKEDFWHHMRRNETLPFWFLEEHISEMGIENVLKHPNTPLEFFDTHPPSRTVVEGIWHNGFDDARVEQMYQAGTLKVERYLSCRKVSFAFLHKHPEFCGIRSEKIIANQHIDLSDLVKLFPPEKLYPCVRALRIHFPEEFLGKCLPKNMNWDRLSANSKLSRAFYEKHRERFVWEILSKNPALPIEFFEASPEKIYWNRLCENTFDLDSVTTVLKN